jgi:hypothetical protein
VPAALGRTIQDKRALGRRTPPPLLRAASRADTRQASGDGRAAVQPPISRARPAPSRLPTAARVSELRHGQCARSSRRGYAVAPGIGPGGDPPRSERSFAAHVAPAGPPPLQSRRPRPTQHGTALPPNGRPTPFLWWPCARPGSLSRSALRPARRRSSSRPIPTATTGATDPATTPSSRPSTGSPSPRGSHAHPPPLVPSPGLPSSSQPRPVRQPRRALVEHGPSLPPTSGGGEPCRRQPAPAALIRATAPPVAPLLPTGSCPWARQDAHDPRPAPPARRLWPALEVLEA